MFLIGLRLEDGYNMDMDQTMMLGIVAVAGLVLLVWLLVLTVFLAKQKRFLREFTQGVSKKDLKAVLQQIVESMKTASREINGLHDRVTEITKLDRKHLQKVGFVRFNPFGDTGGDQSFCLCLLDDDSNGVVITSLHSREQTRIYAKPIVKGKAEGIQFSREETEAVSQAVKHGVVAKEK